jgi:hypothetical protein
MLMDEIIAATLTEDAEATMLDYAAVDARTRSRFIPSARLRNFTPCGTIGGGPLTGRGRSSQETSNLAWAFWRVLGQFVLDPLESLRLPNLARHYRPGNRTAVFRAVLLLQS